MSERVLAEIQKTLPPDWIVRYSKKYRSRLFYFNKNTGKSSWVHPSEEKRGSSDKQELQVESNSNDAASCAFPFNQILQKNPAEILRTDPKFAALRSKAATTTQTSSADSKAKTSRKKKKQRKKLSLPYPDNAGLERQKLKKLKCSSSDSQLSKSVQKRQDLPHGTQHEKIASSSIAMSSKFKGFKIGKKVSGSKIQLVANKSGNRNDIEESITHPKKLRGCPATISHSPTAELQNLSSDDAAMSVTRDVEMKDLTPSGSESVTNSPCFLYVVVDTNIFLSNDGLKNISSIVDWYPMPGRNFSRAIVVVPWIVLQELDRLKSNNKLTSRARQAVGYLNKHFSAKKPGIRGQTIMEAASFFNGLALESNDDRILQCLYYFSHLPGRHVTVLFSRDVNLCNKALVSDFRTFSDMESLLKETTSMSKERDLVLDHDSRLPVVQNKGFACKREDPKVSCDDDNQAPDLSSFRSDEVLRDALSVILETELKKAFGDEMWMEIAYLKPPWSLKDVLRCIKKHWLAVFSMIGVDRLASTHVDLLIEQLKRNDHVTSTHPHFKPASTSRRKHFQSSGLQLLRALTSRQTYPSVVSEAIETLEGRRTASHKPDGTGKSPGDFRATGVESPKRISPLIEDTDVSIVEELDNRAGQNTVEYNQTYQETGLTEVFWQVLDQVWSTIVHHSIAIIRSLSFATSPLLSQAPPELQRQLAESNDEVPDREMSLRVLPLLLELITGLVSSLENILRSCQEDNSVPAASQCLDFLQTLWTTCQAFSIPTEIEKLRPHAVMVCCRSHDDKVQLLNGYNKLMSVRVLLRECRVMALNSNVA